MLVASSARLKIVVVGLRPHEGPRYWRHYLSDPYIWSGKLGRTPLYSAMSWNGHYPRPDLRRPDSGTIDFSGTHYLTIRATAVGPDGPTVALLNHD